MAQKRSRKKKGRRGRFQPGSDDKRQLQEVTCAQQQQVRSGQAGAITTASRKVDNDCETDSGAFRMSTTQKSNLKSETLSSAIRDAITAANAGDHDVVVELLPRGLTGRRHRRRRPACWDVRISNCYGIPERRDVPTSRASPRVCRRPPSWPVLRLFHSL